MIIVLLSVDLISHDSLRRTEIELVVCQNQNVCCEKHHLAEPLPAAHYILYTRCCQQVAQLALELLR